MQLAPYVGIAVAVAVGIVAAPYLGWIVVAVVLFLAACVLVALGQRAWRRLTAAADARWPRTRNP